ncbi:MAG: hypothetical protein IK050_00010, partial [Lachnospiraceae bacterium]|nr:hypothetical protein [Lachnospiraceae bacterium]
KKTILSANDERIERLKAEREELNIKFKVAFHVRYFIMNRIIKAFPEMRSTRYEVAMERFKKARELMGKMPKRKD